MLTNSPNFSVQLEGLGFGGVCINMELDPILELGSKVLEFEKMCQNWNHKYRNLKN
jgi:hypothetical protein